VRKATTIIVIYSAYWSEEDGRVPLLKLGLSPHQRYRGCSTPQLEVYGNLWQQQAKQLRETEKAKPGSI